jgi:hypothetical protein
VLPQIDELPREPHAFGPGRKTAERPAGVERLSTGMRNHDQLAAGMAFGAIRRGRGVATDPDVRDMASSPVGTVLPGGAAARLVALITAVAHPSVPIGGPSQ